MSINMDGLKCCSPKQGCKESSTDGSKEPKFVLITLPSGKKTLIPISDFLKMMAQASVSARKDQDNFVSSGEGAFPESVPPSESSESTPSKSFIDRVKNGFNAFVDGGRKIFNNIKDWFVSQHRSSSNTNEDVAGNGNCGLASLLMLGRLFGKVGGGPAEANDQIEMLRKISGITSNEFEGSNLQQLANGAKRLGLNANVTKASISTLEAGLARGEKFIVGVNPGSLDPGKSKNGAHAIVVLEINRDRGTATIADPDNTTGTREVSLKNLEAAMSDLGNQALAISNPDQSLRMVA